MIGDNCKGCNVIITEQNAKIRYYNGETPYYGLKCRECFNKGNRKCPNGRVYVSKNISRIEPHADSSKLSVILGNKGIVTIDKDSLSIVEKHNWTLLPSGTNGHGRSKHDYAITSIGGKMVKMHRLIMGVTDPGVHVDHLDGDTLNNCTTNLRVCTPQQNSFNQKKHNTIRPPSSSFKGVCWDKARGKWHCGIKHNYKKINIGRFNSEILAAKAYDEKARELFGEHALTNFPLDPNAQNS